MLRRWNRSLCQQIKWDRWERRNSPGQSLSSWCGKLSTWRGTVIKWSKNTGLEGKGKGEASACQVSIRRCLGGTWKHSGKLRRFYLTSDRVPKGRKQGEQRRGEIWDSSPSLCFAFSSQWSLVLGNKVTKPLHLVLQVAIPQLWEAPDMAVGAPWMFSYKKRK